MRSFWQYSQEFVCNEFWSIVGIQTAYLERESPAGLFKGFNDGVCVLVQKRKTLGPAGFHIGEHKTVDERATRVCAAVPYKVCFEVSWPVLSEVIKRTHGNQRFEYRA